MNRLVAMMLQNKFNLDFINEIPKISALQEAWLLSGTPSHSCGARRMADSAAHLVDEVLPKRPIRQWVLSVPFPLRYLFATNPQVMSRVLTITHRVISTFLIKRSGRTVKSGTQSGAVTLIQRFGSALNPHAAH